MNYFDFEVLVTNLHRVQYIYRVYFYSYTGVRVRDFISPGGDVRVVTTVDKKLLEFLGDL